MRGTGVFVDVQAVGVSVDDQRLCAQGLKHRLGNVPGCAVGTVQRHLLALEGILAQADQVADIPVAAGHIVHRAADLVAVRKGNLRPLLAEGLQLAVQIGLDEVEGLLVHLFALAVDQLDAVIEVGIMAGGDHDAAVEIVHTGNICHGGRGGDMQHVRIRAGGHNTGNQRILKHIAGAAGILADHDAGLGLVPCAALLLAKIPAQKAADLIGVIRRQIHIRFTAEAIGSEILAHFCFSDLC